MIPRDFITEWRAQAPWVSDLQVEQDLVISRALVELFSRLAIAEALAFRGGTALYKLHLRPPARYSEDIDLVQVDAGPIGSVLKEVRAALDPWLGDRPGRPEARGGGVLPLHDGGSGPGDPGRVRAQPRAEAARPGIHGGHLAAPCARPSVGPRGSVRVSSRSARCSPPGRAVEGLVAGEMRGASARTVNALMTATYWSIGRRIV